VFTHGTKNLRGYVRRSAPAGEGRRVPRVAAEGPAWAIVDGQSAIGMVTSVLAMETAVRKGKAAAWPTWAYAIAAISARPATTRSWPPRPA